MILTLSTTHRPATDLGYLVHKHPDRVRSVSLNFGDAHVFFPETREDFCEMALLVDVDPIRLVKDNQFRGAGLDNYINDRPYAASSLLSVAIGQTMRSAMLGDCEDRPELAKQAIPLTVKIPGLQCHQGEDLVRRLFEPLGYMLEIKNPELHPLFPEWGLSPYFSVTISGVVRLSDLLNHLYVLIPVLDNNKHYFVNGDEVEKLIRAGGEWIKLHPMKECIISRYVKYKQSLKDAVMSKLEAKEATEPPAFPDDDLCVDVDSNNDSPESVPCTRRDLNSLRIESVVNAVLTSGAKTVLDVGCGEGNLIFRLSCEDQISTICGMDVQAKRLGLVHRKIRPLPEHQKNKTTLFSGSLLYRDKRTVGFDCVTMVEVIEHIDQTKLDSAMANVFGYMRPSRIVVTTPNFEYNVLFGGMDLGQLRDKDHRFEWTRDQFRDWCASICEKHGYDFAVSGVGDSDDLLGHPTQMAVFTRNS